MSFICDGFDAEDSGTGRDPASASCRWPAAHGCLRSRRNALGPNWAVMPGGHRAVQRDAAVADRQKRAPSPAPAARCAYRPTSARRGRVRAAASHRHRPHMQRSLKPDRTASRARRARSDARPRARREQTHAAARWCWRLHRAPGLSCVSAITTGARASCASAIARSTAAAASSNSDRQSARRVTLTSRCNSCTASRVSAAVRAIAEQDRPALGEVGR